MRALKPFGTMKHTWTPSDSMLRWLAGGARLSFPTFMSHVSRMNFCYGISCGKILIVPVEIEYVMPAGWGRARLRWGKWIDILNHYVYSSPAYIRTFEMVNRATNQPLHGDDLGTKFPKSRGCMRLAGLVAMP